MKTLAERQRIAGCAWNEVVSVIARIDQFD